MKLITLLLLTLFYTFAESKAGQIYISVGKGTVKKSLLALPNFKYFGSTKASKANLRVGTELYQTIKNDFDVSTLFTLISPDAFLEDSSKKGLKPYPNDPVGFKFSNWSAISAEFLIKGGYKVVGNNLTLEAYLYYVPQAKLILGRSYTASQSKVRTLGHKFANDAVEALTGTSGMYNSKIAVTANRNGKYKEIYTMDWDGHNIQRLTSHKNLSISPTWSPDGKKVAYTSWAYHPKAKTRNADLFIKDVSSTAQAKLISYRKGINSGANFHPNGRDLFLTLSKSGNADIYRKNLSSGKTTRITRGPRGSMNVEPAISPNGKMLAFSSTRGGPPMVYVMTLSTGSIKRITYAGKYNATPTWSPDSKKIAFAGYDKGHFDIFIMDSKGYGLTRLTSAKKANGRTADNESPTFSPDGRFVMFTSNRTGTNQLYIVDTKGNNERRITYDKFHYEKPSWSKVLE